MKKTDRLQVAARVLVLFLAAWPQLAPAGTIYPTNESGVVITEGRVVSADELEMSHAWAPSPSATYYAAAVVPPVGDGALVTYRAFDGVSYQMRQFIGKHTAVLLKPEDLDLFTVNQARELVDQADLLYVSYRHFYGLEPGGSGLLRIAFVKTCGAGCGYVGSRGVEIAPDYADGVVPDLMGVLAHEMNHNFDRFNSYLFIGTDRAHTWNDFVDSYIRLVDRGGSRTRTPEENVRRARQNFFGPYENFPGATWESCILNAACTGVSDQHAQGGAVLRLAELLDVPSTHRALLRLRQLVADRGLNGSSMTPTQKVDLLVESFSFGARTNLTCYFDTWRWPVSSTLRTQLETDFGASTHACADADQDQWTRVRGDLDDSNPAVHPGAAEVLNGIDDDCNHIVDDVLVSESADFPAGTGSSTGVSVPGRVWGALTAGDGDFFHITLTQPTRVRFSIRSRDGSFKGWLFIFRQGTSSWRNTVHVGTTGVSDTIQELTPGEWDFSVELNSDSAPGQYELVIEEVPEWPVLVHPPTPQNLSSNLWRLSSPPLPAALAGRTNLSARFWVSGLAWIGTNAVAGPDPVTLDWPAPADLDLRIARYRVQFFEGEFAAERVSEPTPFIVNAPPVVILTSPTNATSFQVGETIRVSAEVTDPEGELQWVNFFMNDTLLVSFTAPPFEVTLTNLTAGTYSFKAVATDLPGATVASSVAQVVVSRDRFLITPGAVWRYNDSGTDLLTAWRSPLYNDTAWSAGPAQLGYGDNDETTVVSYGPDSSSKFITTYFRHSFELSDAAACTNLTVHLLRDDGGVVYLNDTEIFRDNMPAGAITFPTRASAGATGGDESTNYHAVGVNAALLRNGTNVVAVEIHQDSAGSSDLSFDLMLVAGASNVPPDVKVTAPADGLVLVAPASFTVTAQGSDPDGLLTQLEIYRGTNRIAQGAAGSLAASQVALPQGVYSYFARGLDRNGLFSTSAPVSIYVVAGSATSFIPVGSFWRYLDDGSNAGTAWREIAFNDSSWSAALAQLGYGDGDERSVVRGTRADSSRIITTWFRRTFSIDDPALVRGLTARLLRDDGAVVYLNGTEVWRENMPATGVITFDTRASGTVNDPEEDAFYTRTLDHTLLVPGTNCVAVEIHQVSSTSSDISFDFELRGTVVTPTSIPLSPAFVDGSLLVSWPAPAVGLRLYQTPSLTPPVDWTPLLLIPTLTNGQYSVAIPPASGSNRFYRLQYP